MNQKDFERRKDEVAKYADTLFNEKPAKKSGYAILGDKNHLIIEEAIKKVYEEMCKRYNEIVNSREFLESKEEQESYKNNPLEYSTVLATEITIDLLKTDGYLEKNLEPLKLKNFMMNSAFSITTMIHHISIIH
ncbi:MAG: hypothetical protein Nk1A_6530 [Endomicrobiia bacterium]|nr:MAG: hypothetical protein Nk1A_6530 [Endomicrobiia bacterium]